MKKDNLKDEFLTELMRNACPAPHHDADFTDRVINRIVKEKRQKEQAQLYWHEQVGMALPKTWRWRLLDWLMSPMIFVVAAVVAVFVFRHEIFTLLRQYWSTQYFIADNIILPMPIVMSAVCGVIVLAVLGGTIAMLNSED